MSVIIPVYSADVIFSHLYCVLVGSIFSYLTLNPLLGATWPFVYFLQGRLGRAAIITRAYWFVCPAIVAKHLWCEQLVIEVQLTISATSNSVFILVLGGWNSSVGSAWARCPQRRRFDPPLGTFSVEGIFPLELTWVQTPFPQKLLWMRV